jgi:hypothetical protein
MKNGAHLVNIFPNHRKQDSTRYGSISQKRNVYLHEIRFYLMEIRGYLIEIR